jgi:hypothetical protein
VILIIYVFDSKKKGRGGEEKNFNYLYVWFTRGGERF